MSNEVTANTSSAAVAKAGLAPGKMRLCAPAMRRREGGHTKEV